MIVLLYGLGGLILLVLLLLMFAAPLLRLLLRLRGKRPAQAEGLTIYHDEALLLSMGRFFMLLGGVSPSAFCPGPFVIVSDFVLSSPHALKNTLKHEAVHVRQWRKWRVLYLPVYLILFVKAGFSYHKHPWEIEAENAERNQ